jgi:hypothetical protein
MNQKLLEQIQRESRHLNGKSGACLYYAHVAMSVFHEAGVKACLQAGDLNWPIMPQEKDDGVSPTHFSFVWSPDTLSSRTAVALGALPEIHVWVGLVDTQEIVDFSTGHLREIAEECGLVWATPDPPDYVWADAEHMPEGVLYKPNLDATLYAGRTLFKLFKPDYLKQPAVC